MNDLTIISEMIESPCEFILYLERRLKLNDDQSIKALDESDYFGYFLETGLLFDERFQNNNLNELIGYGNQIDNYFNHQFGYRSFGEKPRFNMNVDYWNLIRYFEQCKKPYFSEIAITLLKLNSAQILNVINETKTRSLNNNCYSHTPLLCPKLDLCIYISISPEKEKLNLERELGMLGLYKYKFKVKTAIFLAGFCENGEYGWDFGLIEQNWKYNSHMEKFVNE